MVQSGTFATVLSMWDSGSFLNQEINLEVAYLELGKNGNDAVYNTNEQEGA